MRILSRTNYEQWSSGNVIITAYDEPDRPTTRYDSLGSLGEIALYKVRMTYAELPK